MAHKEKLPWELIEEILSYVPPLSLVRFKTLSKQFNSLLNNKTFINNHKAKFRFILSTESKIYSVSINPKIEVRELTLDIDPGLGSKIYELADCNGLMLCDLGQGTLIWNPWLRQTRWLKPDESEFQLGGLGYNNDDNRRVYKILVSYAKESDPNKSFWKIGGFDSDVWNEVESDDDTQDEEPRSTLHSRSVSLDGNLYWVASYPKESMFHVELFDFSTEEFNKYCDLPCLNNHVDDDALVLSVFMEDRLSLLKQCHVSKKIKIWVTKNKIHKSYGKDVEWINFMEVSVPNLPYLQPKPVESPLSYFVEDKRLVVCSTDQTSRAWIYVFGDKKLISETKLDLAIDRLWPLHCTYFPSLVSVPRGQIEEMGLDV